MMVLLWNSRKRKKKIPTLTSQRIKNKKICRPRCVFVISYPPHWGKLKIDFILLCLYPPVSFYFLRAAASQGECPSFQNLHCARPAQQPQGQPRTLPLSIISKSTQDWAWSVQDYGVAISQILFVMDVLPGWQFSSIFKVKNIFSSH